MVDEESAYSPFEQQLLVSRTCFSSLLVEPSRRADFWTSPPSLSGELRADFQLKIRARPLLALISHLTKQLICSNRAERRFGLILFSGHVACANPRRTGADFVFMFPLWGQLTRTPEKNFRELWKELQKELQRKLEKRNCKRNCGILKRAPECYLIRKSNEMKFRANLSKEKSIASDQD